MPPRQGSAAKRHAGPDVQPFAQIPSGTPARIAADQWYAGTQGEQALKSVFDNFTSIADNEVKMNRAMDTQDVSLSLEHRGQHWQVTFPYNFPRSFASVTTGGRNHKKLGGDTVETAVSAIINYILSNQPQAQRRGNPARTAAVQWYAGEQGEAALKYVFDKFGSIADGEVKMSRMTDTQDATLSFEHRGQEWKVAFPFNFPSSSARLTTFGDAYSGIGGETLEIAVRAIVGHISSLNQPHEDMRENASLQMPVHHQWYTGEDGEAALKFIFEELRNVADCGNVTMSRETDTQDVTLRFQQHGQEWQVKFPCNFPRSSASLSYNGTFYAMAGGNTVENAVCAILNRIS